MVKLKDKIIGLYTQNKKLGKNSITKYDFDFIDKYLPKEKSETDIFIVSESLQYIIEEYNKNIILKNKIGLEFLDDLVLARKNVNFFINNNSITPYANNRYERAIIKKYANIALHNNLKNFSYTLSSDISSKENYKKAMILLKKLCEELEKIKKSLKLSNVGNNILSIEVNWRGSEKDEAYYNYTNNTICLKDEKSTFPLVHEYVHFLDKTACCLLLTGRTSQELFENQSYSKEYLYHNFNMYQFKNIKFKKETFPWLDTLKLKLLFNEQIKQNIYIQKTFDKFDKYTNYSADFKKSVVNWIDTKDYPEKEKLKKDFLDVINQKIKAESLTDYSGDKKNLINCASIYLNMPKNKNNAMNWAIEFDAQQKINYYQTDKEILARVIEKTINKKLPGLQDTMSTPDLSKDETHQFLSILKSWHDLCVDVMKPSNVLNKIQKTRLKIQANPEIIKKIYKI